MSSKTKVLLSSEILKIDKGATDGLLGVENSLAYRVHEIERHLHSYERWCGAAVTPDAELHVCDRIGVGVVAFQIDAGNNDWGSWVQIVGSNDMPIDAGNVKYDFHEILITATERNAVYALQFGFGTAGAAALSAGTYTEIMFKPISNQADNGPAIVKSRRINDGTKAWARAFCPSQNTATISFYFGSHEYQG